MTHQPIQTGMLSLFAEVFCLSCALCSGMLAFRYMDRFFRVLLLQVAVWSVFYAIAHLITLYQQVQHRPIDNQWLLNIHLILETGLLLVAARFALPGPRGKVLTGGAFGIFLVVLGLQSFRQGFGIYLHYADVSACLILTTVFSGVLFTVGQRSSKGYRNVPEKWACLGILIYFACSVPYVSMMHYLEVKNPAVNSFLYHLISDLLANFRYLLLAFAFLLIYRTATSQTHSSR